jgi:hypothetical protein
MSPAPTSTKRPEATSSWNVTVPMRPPASFAVATMVWTPVERFARVKLPPVPICPSRFETQRSEALTSPCSGSLAIAEKLTEAPALDIA